MSKEKLCVKEINGTIKNNKIRDYIEESIKGNENLLATVNGDMGDFLVVTNRRVMILKKGVSSWATGGMGLKAKSFMLNQITGIHVNKRLLTCDVEITVAGMNKKQDGGFFSSAESETIVQFTKTIYKEVAELITDIYEIMDTNNGNGKDNASLGKEDAIAKLEKLGALKEKGIITEEEFRLKKEKLLEEI